MVDDDPALTTQSLMPKAYKARPEQAILFRISAWDTNCPQHTSRKNSTPPMWRRRWLQRHDRQRDAQIAELEAELAVAQLRGKVATES